MRSSLRLLSLIVFALGVSTASAQTLNPVLGNIQSPYNPLQGSAKIGGTNWGAGAVAYGPVGTPLVLTGSNLGGGGTVQFVAYKNGVVDTSVTPTQATVTLWTSTMLILTVPSGALSGMVTVSVEGTTSNGLPFLVMPGTYSGSCPAGPTKSQLQIVTSSLHDGAVGQAYSATLQATGGTTSYAWSIIGGLPAGLSLNSSTGTISGTPTAATGSNPTPLTIQVVDSSSPNQTDQAEMNLTVQPQQMSSGTIYSYVVGHDGDSNVTSFQDQTWNSGPGVMGKWSITGPTGGSGYDSLNRLMGANVIWPDGTQQYLCWNYDPFGNRVQQEISSAAFQSGSGGPNSCTAQSSATLETDLSSYTSSSNQATSTNARGVSATPGYDGAGDMMSDGLNAYLYDAEGRVCAVQSSPLPGSSVITGYLYDGDGNRVAKGTLTNCTSLTNCTCDPTSNGFQFTENYVLGTGGEELSMMDGNNNWQRTNLFVSGKLIGTYNLITSPSSNTQIPWLSFHLEDPLGTRRMQVSGMLSNLGQPEMDFQSLPFGDQLAPFTDPYGDPSTGGASGAIGATPLFYTGKERDPETGGLNGNDFFGARYYSSPLGRFLSPDWSAGVEPVPYSLLENPQSLNLYIYVGNNPLLNVDEDGHQTVPDVNCGWLCRLFHQKAPTNDTPFDNTLQYFGAFARLGVGAMHGAAWAVSAPTKGGYNPGPSPVNKSIEGQGAALGIVSTLFIPGPDEFASIQTLSRDQIFAEISNPALRHVMDEFWRPGSTVGDGSTAAAIEYEMSTGLSVGGTTHSTKGRDSINAFRRILRSQNLTENERAIVRYFLQRTEKALGL